MDNIDIIWCQFVVSRKDTSGKQFCIGDWLRIIRCISGTPTHFECTRINFPRSSIYTPILNYTRPLRMHDRICVALVGHWQSLYSHCQGKTKSWIDRAKQLLVRKQRFIDHYCHLEQKRWQHQASCYIKNNLLVQPVGLWNHSISGGTTTEIKLRYSK